MFHQDPNKRNLMDVMLQNLRNEKKSPRNYRNPMKNELNTSSRGKKQEYNGQARSLEEETA